MAYTFNVNSLTTKNDCTELINKLTAKKNKLSQTKQTMEWDATDTAALATKIEVEATDVVAELDNIGDRLTTIPEGKKKKLLMAKQKSVESRQLKLAIRRDDHGIVPQLQREQVYATTVSELALLDELIASVQTKKDSLAA